ncbi:tRNA lysidine(34) synthetase TilS [Pediococcus cellicola]|uniref:tRNA lysidine(34) synthetase TilS n=1 Tax=Pediococcus cellicola TaxID=319652 RepID=UPI00070B96F7|nr:tRNA lysidine(34) synthetase TilS [Pediococcus cellicola]GEL16086.1 tRNA(Ile)-lysidine synthase [Pediococcus cellicola]
MADVVQKQFGLTMRRCKLTPQTTVVVAVSTGVDSMTLLALLETLPLNRRPKIVIAHVNHKLRAQSTEEQQFLTNYAKQHHLKLEIKVWSVAEHPQTGVENAARQIRYAFFAKMAQKYQAKFLFTAHHADDQAETFLMKLVRGGDLQQLQGIRSRQLTRNTQIIRPLLNFSKQELRQFAKQKKISWYEDQTNSDEAFTRNRMRHEIVPRLKAENPQFLQHVQDYEEQLQIVLRAMDQQAQKLVEDIQGNGGYHTGKFLALSSEWQNVVLRYICVHQAVAQVTKRQQTEILQLIRNYKKPNGSVQINAKWVFCKRYQKFGFYLTTKSGESPQEVGRSMLRLNQWYAVENYGKLGVFELEYYPKKDENKQQVMLLSESQIKWPLSLRYAQPTDQFSLKDNGHKKVRRILVDAKIPVEKRATWPLIVDANNRPVWLIGLRKNWLADPLLTDTKQYFLIWKTNNLEELN